MVPKGTRGGHHKEDLVNKLKSRKFWIAVLTAVFIILTEGLDVGISAEAYWALATVAVGYIAGESYVDARK